MKGNRVYIFEKYLKNNQGLGTTVRNTRSKYSRNNESSSERKR